jgi:hypothetical protein
MRGAHFVGGLFAGLLVMLAGFGYFAATVGVPSHDATPEVRAIESHHSNVTDTLLMAGLGIVLVTVLLGCVHGGRALVARARRR